MISTSAIKKTVAFLLLVLGSLAVGAQDFDDLPREVQDSLRKDITQRYAIFTFGGLNPFVTKSSAFGRASELDGIGYQIGAQMFIIDGFFVGAHFEHFKFNITNPLVVGSYDRTSVDAIYLEAGYEHEFNRFLNAGLSIAPIGDVKYENSLNDQPRAKSQKDKAGIFMFKGYLRYNFTSNLSIYGSYAYRTDILAIDAPSRVQDDFEKIGYHTLSFGLKVSVGLRSMFRRPPYFKDNDFVLEEDEDNDQ